jgi:alpha-beta hydrolase superfamily lysophospholipase
VVFFQHFRGNLDGWDPALVDDIASECEVILFDSGGVGLSKGATPPRTSPFATHKPRQSSSGRSATSPSSHVSGNIQAPTLVANGDNDIMVPTVNSYLLAGHIPNAKLTIYPDANHGFLFQYPHEFAAEVNAFLAE